MASLFRTIVIFVGLVILKFCISLPFLSTMGQKLKEYLEGWSDVDFRFGGRYFDWTSIPAISVALSDERGREAYKGRQLPNVKLTFVDRSPCHLFNFMRPHRPLVLNFMSSVEEPFWTELKAFNNMARRMSWMADFLTVVIGCGVLRSKDNWSRLMDTDLSTCIHHHYCMHDRKTVATFLVDAGIAGDLVYDTPSNEAERKFAASPERLFVIYRHIITYVGSRGIHSPGYQVEELRVHLWKLYRKVQKDNELLEHSMKMRKGWATKREQEAPPSFADNDPRNPRNVVKKLIIPRQKRSDTEPESDSGESGITDATSNEVCLLSLPQRSILRNSTEIPLVAEDAPLLCMEDPSDSDGGDVEARKMPPLPSTLTPALKDENRFRPLP